MRSTFRSRPASSRKFKRFTICATSCGNRSITTSPTQNSPRTRKGGSLPPFRALVVVFEVLEDVTVDAEAIRGDAENVAPRGWSSLSDDQFGHLHCKRFVLVHIEQPFVLNVSEIVQALEAPTVTGGANSASCLLVPANCAEHVGFKGERGGSSGL